MVADKRITPIKVKNPFSVDSSQQQFEQVLEEASKIDLRFENYTELDCQPEQDIGFNVGNE